MYRNPGFKNEELIKALENATGLDTSVSVSHLWDKYLADKGFTDGTLDDRMYAFLGSEGFVEDINHRLRVGGMEIGGLLSRDFTNKFLQREFKRAITFSRDSTVNGWTKDANGDPILTEFAIDQPAFVIDPATGQRLGYRALAGFTNSLLWNRKLDDPEWSGSATVAQDAVGLDGVANTAWTVTDDSTGSLESRRQDLTIADDTATHAAVFFVKKDSDESRFPELNLYLTGGTSQFQATQINTATGEITDRASSGTSKSESVGDFWKVTLTNTNNNSGNTNLRYVVAPAATTTLGTTEASATGSIVYDFGGVYLNSSIAGPPIETEGSPVSTAADDATEPLPESCQDGFVWVVHARFQDGNWLGSFTGSGINIVRVNERTVQVFVDGTKIVDISGDSVPDDSDFRIAVRAQAGRYAVCVNGGTVATNSTDDFPNNLDTKDIGRWSGGYWDSTIALDKMYDNPGEWTDADLQNASAL